jgi:TolA-binding protein
VSADTIQRFPLVTVSAMVAPTSADGSPLLRNEVVTRLVQQYSALAEVTEQLTYRMIDLEERLADQQRQIAALCERGQAGEPGPQSRQRLEETDLRLAQIEALLTGAAGPSSLRGRSARLGAEMPPNLGDRVDRSPCQEEADANADGLFPRDQDQPLMDGDLPLPLAG